jgi:poly(3-hydroxybutyrate) depolymerase
LSTLIRIILVVASLCASPALFGQEAPDSPATNFKDEIRMPWQRSGQDFIRQWLIVGPFTCELATDCLSEQGGEEAVQPTHGNADWQSQKSWGDIVEFEALSGNKDGAVAYAFTKISRPKAGKVLLSAGSGDGIRLWVNGKQVLARDNTRALTFDEDQVEVDMNAGDNALLVKVAARRSFTLRVMEPGTVVSRLNEIGPSLVELSPVGFTLATDTDTSRTDAEPVQVEVIRPGGAAVFTTTAPRGARVAVDARSWSDGPYEVRCSTRDFRGLNYVTHLAWYKGDALAKARELARTVAQADLSTPEGYALKMLAEMVDDRLGVKLAEANGNPWQKIHSPLMEYEELMLERHRQVGRIRADGFVRLAWRDEVDGTVQFARAYLPPDYDASKKWPLVINLHGFNPANPVYWRWWGVDSRHPGITEFANHQTVIYMEPHGRGNTQYLDFGDADVLRAIAEAKRLFNVDEDRVYLMGNSMGGWGTWNVASRHPDLFAAIAPVFGGVDYHSVMSEEEIGKLLPVDRFLRERDSTWSMAEGLLNMPILVHHGDQDPAVNVEWSRWGVQLLQRWGYNVRYHEYPGRVHEALGELNPSIEWFLQHRRDPNPRHVRIRSAELRNASSYWVHIKQGASPLAFMIADAEVLDRNVIRLDTDNVLDVVLSPSAALIDPAKSVKVVWNGVAHEMSMQKDELRLTSPDYKPAKLHKNERLPGGTYDFLVTPFAIVIGTSSKDADMVALCREKAQSFIDWWSSWQKREPRVFLDTEITDADIERYSLLLIGGPDANRVAAKLAGKLPIKIATDRIDIHGKQYNVRDAAVQMLYPHPRNSERYIWMIAGTSADGMFFADPNRFRVYDWDYIIVDGRIPAYKQGASPMQVRVVSGLFDYNWRFSESLSYPGDVDVRAKGRQLRRPKLNVEVDPKILATYIGQYQTDGPMIEIHMSDGRLIATVGDDESELVPESESSFYSAKDNVYIEFVRDAAGKVTGFTSYWNGDFEGRKLD